MERRGLGGGVDEATFRRWLERVMVGWFGGARLYDC